ncbi:WD40/YVTN/BNR-like repeat-containing protein [Paenibacillus hodogayensis]|uniref:WD40/YVTN/BNR-like repeat-containing protein n=1 Tax=Paenibacillus hodogayensis TaxID=279208 RepID=A0ABV5W188_9BACL
MTFTRLFRMFLLTCALAVVLGACSPKAGESAQPASPPASGTGTNGGSQSPDKPADGGAGTPGTTSPVTGSPAPGEAAGGSAQKPPAAVKMDRITAMRLADAKSGWVGGDGWIARTDDGGATWTKPYSVKGIVHQLFALNGQDVWAVVGAEGAAADAKKVERSLLVSKDGGSSWTAAGTVPNAGFLHFVAKEEAYSANAKTTDGGKTWTTLPVPEELAVDPYFHDAANGWAVALEKDMIVVKRTTDGGKTWQDVMSRKTVSQVTGGSIRSAGAEDAWVELIGESGMTQTSYSLFHTTDGGKTWQTVLANSTAGAGPAPGFPIDHSDGPKNGGNKPGPLYVVNPQVAFMGGQCMACDKPNTIGWTTDGGKTWVNGETAFTGYGEQLLAISDAHNGWWICTDNAEPAVMYTTADGGKTWKKAHTFEKPSPQS